MSRAGRRSRWHARLTLDAVGTGVAGPGVAPDAVPAALSGFVLEAEGPQLRHLARADRTALVAGLPRPVEAPSARDAEPDPALGLLHAYDARGLPALRQVEGGWALVVWDGDRGELLLAVDRLARQDICLHQGEGALALAGDAAALAEALGLEPDPARLAAWINTGHLPAGETLYPAIERLRPGEHRVRRANGRWQSGGHGTWQVERRDRRAWPLILGEFQERLKSVLRVLAERAELGLLAEHPWSFALMASALASLPEARAQMVWAPGLSAYRPVYWQRLASHFETLLAVPAALRDPVGIAAVAPAPPREPGAPAARGGLGAALRAWPGAAEQQHRPRILLSAAGFEVALPHTRGAWKRPGFWQPWAEDQAPRPGEIGARLAEGFSTEWKPRLESATAGTGIELAWPFLDETVAQFLANLPPGLRHGRLGSAPFRIRLLRGVLDPRIYRALAAEGLR